MSVKQRSFVKLTSVIEYCWSIGEIVANRLNLACGSFVVMHGHFINVLLYFCIVISQVMDTFVDKRLWPAVFWGNILVKNDFALYDVFALHQWN